MYSEFYACIKISGALEENTDLLLCFVFLCLVSHIALLLTSEHSMKPVQAWECQSAKACCNYFSILAVKTISSDINNTVYAHFGESSAVRKCFRKFKCSR